MEIRSITFFCDPNKPLGDIARAAEDAQRMTLSAGYRLQTVRLATTPFGTWLTAPSQVATLVYWCGQAGIDYLALGPVRLDDDERLLSQIPLLVAAHDIVFASAEIADCQGWIDTGRVRRVAETIQELARVRRDGFANLFFAATANCRSGSPFFPVAYHSEDGRHGAFAIAAEAAELATAAFCAATTILEARSMLLQAIEDEAQRLIALGSAIESAHGIPFQGIDFSLAPYPDDVRSIGRAMEALGVPAVGGHGSLFAAAFMADCVEQAEFPRCGFSSLMFPVLEDAILARRAAEGTLAVNDLLLYSAVCGTGLDTVPLPGDIDRDELAALLLDLAALAVRADKPLTARLMPLPGLKAGDGVSFDFSYFAASKVMATKGLGLSAPMAGAERISLRPLSRRSDRL